MDEMARQKTAEKLVCRLEGGDTRSLSEELNSMSMQDRLSVAKTMDELNDKHRRRDIRLPDLVLKVSDDGGQERLLNILLFETFANGSGMKISDIYDYLGQPLYAKPECIPDSLADTSRELERGPAGSGKRRTVKPLPLPADAWANRSDPGPPVRHLEIVRSLRRDMPEPVVGEGIKDKVVVSNGDTLTVIPPMRLSAGIDAFEWTMTDVSVAIVSSQNKEVSWERSHSLYGIRPIHVFRLSNGATAKKQAGITTIEYPNGDALVIGKAGILSQRVVLQDELR
jgi:hypothetical protein